MYKNNFHITKDLGLYIGPLPSNKPHQHYAIQISIVVNDSLIIADERNEVKQDRAFFISSNVFHQLVSKEVQLTILINPFSTLGHRLHVKYGQEKIAMLNDEISLSLENLLRKYLKQELTFDDFTITLRSIFAKFEEGFTDKEDLLSDPRIIKALGHLDKNFNRVVSLSEIASLCTLSETRFLHLFKEKTKLNFRRFQLWNRLVSSIPYLQKLTITEVAHQFGFTDSAHYSRTFTETFGLSPKFLLPRK